MFELKVQVGDPAKWQGDGIVLTVFKGEQKLSGPAGSVDQLVGGALSAVLHETDFKGDIGQTRVVYTLGKLPAARVCLVSLGLQSAFTLDRARRAVAVAARALRKAGARTIALPIVGPGAGGIGLTEAAQANAEGLVMGLWRFRKYRQELGEELQEESDRNELDSATLLVQNEADLPDIREAVERGRIIGEATNLARDLANEPGNQLTPMRMAETAREVAEKNGLEFRLIDRKEAERLGMGAFLGVAQGSDQPPAMFIMRYWGAGKDQQGGLGLIGKGITFDSGGISLKPGLDMEHMKGDMSGGAAVIAAMQGIAQLKPKVNVTGMVAATENLPSGHAYKPGDILRAFNGKTIEVNNTDAEGRLVLADAVAYATKELGLDTVVDAATLTGAIVIALGHHRTGLFSNDPSLAQEIMQAGERTGERMWQMPMDPEYRLQLRSDWADLKNSGGRPGGSITGAWFIRSFVENGARWAHLDIAGSAHLGDGKERGYINKFGTGVPTRTFIELALARANNRK